jgi:hypothetical protein
VRRVVRREHGLREKDGQDPIDVRPDQGVEKARPLTISLGMSQSWAKGYQTMSQ